MAGSRVSLRTVKRAAVAAVVLAVLAVALPLGYGWWEERRSRCADGVVRMGPAGECVGVTDGSHVFAGHLKNVTDKIKEQNDLVVGSGDPYVSVAYMTSFTLEETDSNPEESVRHELQGAHVAQRQYNRNGSPKVRLLIANTGSNSRHWEHTVDELVRLAGDGGTEPGRLVAVAGLGPSTDRNLAAVKRLSKRGLATVASTMTATSIGGMEGFVRVTPTNDDEAVAAARYLKCAESGGYGGGRGEPSEGTWCSERGKAQKGGEEESLDALVVQDTAKGNLYARTLGKAFSREFPEDDEGYGLVARPQEFDSSVPGSWRNELHLMMDQLCLHRSDVVYFAGRGQHLGHFLRAASRRTCLDEWDFTLVTGDDTSNLTRKQAKEAADRGIDVYYTALAHPLMWEHRPDTVPGELRKAFLSGLRGWFPPESHEDGQAMMAHDAVLVAVEGVRLASFGGGGMTGRDVGRMFRRMHGTKKVRGATGPLSFDSDGNRESKAIPVLKLGADGSLDYIETIVVEVMPEEGPAGR
ncbi:branched-chain amino acid ABC transporter substrate-binding protein [Streptomyces nanhaiensis]|uniref:branched-chain amino acid ABC transporter substrate-binding protein n=1 Tax=Streptomyces nanhaiensis TaxID=679319 RepID=UPI00399C7DFA